MQLSKIQAQQNYLQLINLVLERLDQWRLRVAGLVKTLLCRQLGSPSRKSASGEMDQFLDSPARAIVDIFELFQPEGSVKKESDSTSVMASTHPGSVGFEGKRNESGPSLQEISASNYIFFIFLNPFPD